MQAASVAAIVLLAFAALPPTRRMFAETVLLASREDLGASVDFGRFQQVVVFWHRVRDDITFEMRGDYQWVSDDAPFFLRPYVRLRGVQAMRIRASRCVRAA